MDHIPVIKEWIPQFLDYASGIDVQGNLDGLFGIFGGIYGAAKSGVHLDDLTLQAKKIALYPILSIKGK